MFNTENGKMISGKEYANLLYALLHAHLAPRSLQSIKQVRKTYKELRGQVYPVTDDELAKRLPAVEVPARPELSDQVEAELAAIPPEEAE